MNEKDIDFNRLTQELDTDELIEFSLPVEQAGLVFAVLQMGLSHPDLESTSSVYKRGRAFSFQLQDMICSHSPYFRELVDRGWAQMSLATLEDEKKKEPLSNFSDLTSGKRYQTALLCTALGMATSWLNEVTDQSLEEINKVVFQLAECNLAENDYEAVPEIINKIDNGKVID